MEKKKKQKELLRFNQVWFQHAHRLDEYEKRASDKIDSEGKIETNTPNDRNKLFTASLNSGYQKTNGMSTKRWQLHQKI